MSNLTIKTETPDEQLTVIKLLGIFEGMTAIESEAQLLEIVKNTGTPQLWVDFAEIVYIDSAAVGILITTAKAAIAKNIHFMIWRPNVNVKKVLTVTHVDRLIPIIDE